MKDLPLFDLNGDFGNAAVRAPRHPDARDLLAHMDYLGIERCLTTHVHGREMNPLVGNRALLQALAAEPSAAGRLVPVFTINPATHCEQGALPFLREQLAAGATRALAAFPAVCRHPLSHLEPVLAELEPFRPVVFWDTTENPNGELDYRDLVDLAGRLPQIAFICRKKMWMGFGSVLDAMRRRPNIHAEISWLHMRSTIELLVRTFGAGRVFFGTGLKTHYGAAIAALAHADISDAERQAIAHGNIERLLGLPPAGFTVAGGRADKPVWDRVRAGRPAGTRILDAHGHIGASNRGWYLTGTDIAETARETIRQMDGLGIGRIIVSPEEALFGDALAGARQAAAELAPFRDRFSGYVCFNPRFADALVPEFDALFGDGFHAGFKILASYWKINVEDPGYGPALRYADAHRLPVLYHTWDDRYNSPRMLESVARAHPNAQILLGHSGGGTDGRIEAIALARRYPNVHLEFCGSFTTGYPWPETFAQVGFDRVVFGSDGGGAHGQAWELGHLLSQPVPDNDLLPVLAANMERILAKRLP